MTKKTIIKNCDYYLNLEYEIIIKKISAEDGGGWFATYKDFKGVMGDGATPQEAIEDAQEAFKAFITVALENNDPIMEPFSHEKSVRINISMPESLVAKIDDHIKPLHLTRSAFLQKVSLKEML